MEILGAELCVDPAWNMLLDLFISAGQGRELSVSAACIGSLASYSTAMRYVNLLVDVGLVERKPDASDRRRSYLSLTDSGRAAMAKLLACPAAHGS
ncbi:MarR family transcriptional regulator [Sphingomonas parva]|nr:MarR family transcriptional regulator [Sphingomonas parva]